MASIYKDKKTGKYKIAYYPRPHVRRIITGCHDLKGTQAIARKLEDEARQIRRGVIDTKAERLSHSEALPLADHLTAFVTMMRGKGVTENHVKRTEAFIKGVVEACGFKAAGYLDAAKVSAHVADLKANGKHTRSINARLTAIKSFTRWLFRTERMRTDPMMQVAKLNAKADRRHVRRALTDDELARLIAAAQAGPAWTWKEGNGETGDGYRRESRSITGADRAMLYRLAAETGLRAGELASLTPTSFLLADLDKATVKVSAAYSKHRRDDLVPLRRDFAQAVAAFLKGWPATAPLFSVPDRTADMLRSDLEAARQAWLKEARTPEEREEHEKTYFCTAVDSSGHVVDFHALRHTFITRLARSGVAPAVAKSLARHSTITLTMDHYTHTLIGDERAALDRLPTMNPVQLDREAAKATGTYNTTAKDPEKRIAHALARSDPGGPNIAIAGQHHSLDSEGTSSAQLLMKAGTWQRTPTPANKTGPLAQWLEQGTHNPLVVGSNPTGPSKVPPSKRLSLDKAVRGMQCLPREPHAFSRDLTAFPPSLPHRAFPAFGLRLWSSNPSRPGFVSLCPESLSFVWTTPKESKRAQAAGPSDLGAYRRWGAHERCRNELPYLRFPRMACSTKPLLPRTNHLTLILPQHGYIAAHRLERQAVGLVVPEDPLHNIGGE